MAGLSYIQERIERFFFNGRRFCDSVRRRQYSVKGI